MMKNEITGKRDNYDNNQNLQWVILWIIPKIHTF